MIQLSSTPAGTPLKGINFLKNQTDPVAMEDSEYPSWLWEVLKKQGKKAEEGKEGDLFCKWTLPFFCVQPYRHGQSWDAGLAKSRIVVLGG